MRTLFYILCSFFLLFPELFFAQQLRFKHITSEEGLSTNFVKAIIQDDLGFMWFGTQDGLNKYDGYQIRTFHNDPSDPTSLSCSDVTALKQVSHELILIGTREGMEFFNPITETFSQLQRVDGRLETQINAFYQIDEENILIGTAEGLFILNTKSRLIKNPYFKNEINVDVRAIEKVNDIVYVGTHGKGLWRLDKKNSLEKVKLTIAEFSKFSAGKANFESITHIGHYAGMLYLGTNGSGIFKVDRNHEVLSRISFAGQNENSDFIRDFIIRNNQIFVATSYGLNVYNLLSGQIKQYVKQDSPLALNSNLINCIFSDIDNNFWIGTDVGGVNISFFRSQKFPTSPFNYETNYPNIFSFLEERKNSLLIGAEHGFYRLNTETGESEDLGTKFANSTALCLARDKSAIVWAGTAEEGLFRYDPRTGVSSKIKTVPSGTPLRSILVHNGLLYVASQGEGLYCISLENQVVSQITQKNNLPSDNLISLFLDSQQRLWIGSSDAGLVCAKIASSGTALTIVSHYTNKGKQGQIASNMVLGINEDKTGIIWAATSTGLSKLQKDGSFRNFYAKDGIANTYIYSVLRDSLSNFWLTTNGGIIKFNPQMPEKETIFKNYNNKDGLVNTEHNPGAALLGRSGIMYVGGPKGFNAFRPFSIKDNLHAPEVYITSYKRGGTDVEMDSLITYKKHLELNWDENFFQFELVAVDYTDPEKNKFRYMLEGYDRDWSAPTTVRFVSYTALPGGVYTFKVKAANNDGTWNEQSRDIVITVIPPFWKTKTFYFLVILFLLASIYFYTQHRTRAIIRENKILEQKVAVRTKELQEKNRDITSSIEYAKRIQEAILPSKEHIFRKLKKVFILYQPKDIVSGDFYWFAEQNGVKIFAVVDCTGHGVPGAFMSMIGHNLLHQIVSEREITDPGEILNQLHRGVQDALRQGHNEINTNDGMDVSLIAISERSESVKWAGANRPLVVIDKSKNLVKYDGNKFPVGGAQLDLNRVFTTHNIVIDRGSMAYMFTDGYADQFGGEKGKKFMVKRFHELLADIHMFDAESQRQALKDNFESWKQNHEQVDDVLIVGIEV